MAGENQTLAYVDPEGKPVALSPDQVETFTRLGYRPQNLNETVTAALGAQRQNEYGDTSEAVRAFGERALSGATLGLSDAAFTGLGVDSQDLAGRAEVNPRAALAGTLTGAIGSSLIGGELGAAEAAQSGRGLAYTAEELGAIKGASNLGTAGQLVGLTPAAKVTALTERILAGGAERGVVGKAATQALGYGVEGALFNSGQYLSDVVLHDKKVSGEAFVAAMEGALFGAGLGGGLSLLGAATRSGADALSGLLGRKADTLVKKVEEAVPDTTLERLTPKVERTPEAIARAESNAETAISEQHTKVDGLIADSENLLSKATQARTQMAGDALDSHVHELFQTADKRIATEGNAQYAELEARLEKLKASKERVKAWQDSLKTYDPVTGEVPSIGQPRNVRGQAYGTSKEAEALFGQKRGLQKSIEEERAAANARMAKGAKGDVETFREGVEALSDYERTSFTTAQAYLDLLEKAPTLAESAGPEASRISEDFAPYLDAVARDTGEAPMGPGAKDLFAGLKPTQKQSERIARDQARADAKAFREADKASKAELKANVRLEKDTTKAETAAERAKTAKPEKSDFSAGDVLGLLATSHVPVIGPVLSPLLLAWKLKGKLGKIGKLVSSATGGPMVGVAEKATMLRNRLADAVETGLQGAKGAESGLLPTAIALKAPLFEAAEKPLRPPVVLAERAGKTNEALAAYNERAKELSQAVANPDKVKDRLLHQYPVNDAGLADSIWQTAMNKLNYAYDQLPLDHEEPSIYGETVHPSDVELERFAQVVDALQRPAAAMKELLKGTPLAHVADAIKAVYPSLYAEAQGQVLDKIAKDPGAIPYEKRVTLSLLFDLTADRTMRPEYLARIQSAGGEAAQAQAAQPVASISARTRLGAAEQTVASRVAGGVV